MWTIQLSAFGEAPWWSPRACLQHRSITCNRHYMISTSLRALLGSPTCFQSGLLSLKQLSREDVKYTPRIDSMTGRLCYQCLYTFSLHFPIYVWEATLKIVLAARTPRRFTRTYCAIQIPTPRSRQHKRERTLARFKSIKNVQLTLFILKHI